MEDRTSKWKRKNNPDRLVLQPRDKKIINAIYSFRILTRQQIQLLFNLNGERRINQRLRKLYDHKYLSRSFLPTTRGSAKAIYYLGPQGKALVADELGIDLNIISRRCKANAKLQQLFLTHTLGLNDIRIAFSLGIARNPEIKLERWINDNDCHQEYQVAGQGKDVTRRFRPDGYFRIVNQDKLYSFFIEYDRSTMTLERFATKVRSYIDFGMLGYYQQRFGVKYFRVLVVTKTGERLANIKKVVETITDQLFWFTTMEQVTPDVVFGPIWQRPGQQAHFSLIES